MNWFDLLNIKIAAKTVAEPEVPGKIAPARGSGGTVSPPTAVGAFLTPQTFVAFPLASGLVAGIWRAIQSLLPNCGKSLWVGVGIAALVAFVGYLVSSADPRAEKNPTWQSRGVQIAITAGNAIYLYLAALGIKSV